MRKTIVFLAIWVIVVNLFSWIAFNRIYLTEPDKALPASNTQYVKPHNLNFLEMHERGDSAWYITIAAAGYSFSRETQSNVNFFPLFPMLIKVVQKLVTPFTPNLSSYYQYILSGTLISLVFLFIAIYYLYKLLLLDYNQKIATRAVFYLLIFPASFFLLNVYTESLFLALAVGTFYYGRENKWIQSGMIGFFASLTKSIGVLLFISLLIEFLKQLKRNEARLRDIIFLFLIPAGLGVFMVYLSRAFNDPIAFIHAAEGWGRKVHLGIFDQLKFQIDNALVFSQASRVNILLEIGYLIFGAILSVIVIKEIRASYGLYSLLGVLTPISTGVLISQARYTLVLFPLFIPLALLSFKNNIFHFSYTVASLLLLSLNIVLFVNSYLV